MKLALSLFSMVFIFLRTAASAHAVCPICTVVVGAGLGVSRRLGIDDTITGIWIGGLILSSGFWLADWVGKRSWKIPYKKVIFVLLFYLFVIPSLYWGKMIGIAGNTLWGVDKVILGTITGSIVFLLSVWFDKALRKINNDKVYIYYQKVIIPVFLLSIVSFVFFLMTK